jgi:hypothetical protein
MKTAMSDEPLKYLQHSMRLPAGNPSSTTALAVSEEPHKKVKVIPKVYGGVYV